VEVHINRRCGFPVEHHHRSRLQTELVLDKLAGHKSELDGVDLVRRGVRVSGPPGFGLIGGPSGCPPTGFNGCWVWGGWVWGFWVWGCWVWGFLGLGQTRDHETERVESRGRE
jgi:hypothetical protein